MEKIKVTVWNEYYHERTSEKIAAIYPDGIHGAIAEGLKEHPEFEVRTATLEMPECDQFHIEYTPEVVPFQSGEEFFPIQIAQVGELVHISQTVVVVDMHCFH